VDVLLPAETSKLLTFETAAQAVLAYLQNLVGFDLWMVTRTEGNDWIVLQSSDRGYGVKAGDVFNWADSFCSRMIQGQGPRIAPCARAIQSYAEAPIARQVTIGAYIGVPLNYSDGSLFGTLCAIDPHQQPEEINQYLPLVELFAQLLSSILHAELLTAEQTRYAERLQTEALNDALTGLYNRRGWNDLLDSEEERCHRYGDPATIMVIDLDNLKTVNDTLGHGAGDTLIQRAAVAMKRAVRNRDIVARVGGDEFAILCVDCPLAMGAQLKQRLQFHLESAQVQASIGLAGRRPGLGLHQAWAAADQAMYLEKRRRKPCEQPCVEPKV
jgi:diguanylate cyclase